VILLWLLLGSWTGALHLSAYVSAPPGRVFVGTFHWVDDVYNYLSYVQQAEAGQWRFRNKLLPPAEAKANLVNLEWWTVGQLSRLLGGRPFLAYRLLGLGATLMVVVAADRWLCRIGLAPCQTLAALTLVFFGGGLGGLLFEFTDLPASRCLDLSVAMFPFVEVLANPHFLVGTALLVLALFAFATLPVGRATLVGGLLGTALGLVRPYDLVLLGAIRLIAIPFTTPPRRWLWAAAPLCGLLPVLGYDLWVFFGSRQFQSFQRGSAFPYALDFLPAIGPALVLASLSWRVLPRSPESGAARVHLWAWVAIGIALILARPGSFSLQFLVGLGLPLLLLAALGLGNLGYRAMLCAVVALCSSSVVATRIALAEDPNWYVPKERLAVATALRTLCGPDDLLLAPPDIELYAIGLSACHAAASHPAAPDYQERVAEARLFYSSLSPEDRTRLLDVRGVTRLVLAGDYGPVPVVWLGDGTHWRRLAQVGRPPTVIAIYGRTGTRAIPQASIASP
jgi:hypothetical protein